MTYLLRSAVFLIRRVLVFVHREGNRLVRYNPVLSFGVQRSQGVLLCLSFHHLKFARFNFFLDVAFKQAHAPYQAYYVDITGQVLACSLEHLISQVALAATVLTAAL